MRLYSAPVVESGANTGATWLVHDTRRADKRVYVVVMTSGTATWLLEGRIGDGTDTSAQTWTTIDTGTASKSAAVSVYPQMRFRTSASTALIGHCDLDADGRLIAGFSAGRSDA